MATVIKRKDRIEIKAYAGINPATGKERRISKTLPLDADEHSINNASMKLDEKAAVLIGNSELMTVSALFDYYLNICKLDGMSPTTLSSYRSYLNKHIKPELGSMYIDKVDNKLLSRFFRSLRDDKELSQATVCKIKHFMSGCFNKLIADGEISVNPMIGVKLPYPKINEAEPLSDDDLNKLTHWIDTTLNEAEHEDVDDESFAALVNAALGTGCRRAELAGFTVGDLKRIDAETYMLRVKSTLVYSNGRNSEIIRKEPKSRHSKRNITLDHETAVSILVHIINQEELLYRCSGLIQSNDTPLFARSDGKPFAPDDISSRFRKLVCKLGMSKSVHMHTLRHTHATRLLEEGVDIVTLQERLGHEDAKTTMNIYGHVMPGRDREAANKYAEMRKFIGSKSVAGTFVNIAPKCPLSGEMCARFNKSVLDN